MDPLKFSFDPPATPQHNLLEQLLETVTSLTRCAKPGKHYAYADERRIPVALLEQLRKDLRNLGIKP